MEHTNATTNALDEFKTTLNDLKQKLTTLELSCDHLIQEYCELAPPRFDGNVNDIADATYFARKRIIDINSALALVEGLNCANWASAGALERNKNN